MNIGKACAIFEQIDSNKYTDAEKLEAVREVVEMPTHNGITKDKMLAVLRWFTENTEPDTGVPRWIPVSDPPKETGHYLVSLHQENPEGDLKDIVLDAWFQKEVFLFTSSEAGWHLLNEFYDLTPQLREYITHWMPLPEPPEVE